MSGEFVLSSAADVGRFFGYSRQTIYEWKTRGMPVLPDGKFDVSEIAQWREASRQESLGGTDIEAAELRDKLAAARLKEIKVAERLKQLVDRATIVTQERQHAAIVRSRLQAFPGELASNIPPDLRNDVVIIAENTVDGLLRELSECQLPQSSNQKLTNGTPKPTKRRTSGKKSTKNTRQGRSRAVLRGPEAESSMSSEDHTIT